MLLESPDTASFYVDGIDALMQGLMMVVVCLYTSGKLGLTDAGQSEFPKVEIPIPKASITVCECINILQHPVSSSPRPFPPSPITLDPAGSPMDQQGCWMISRI